MGQAVIASAFHLALYLPATILHFRIHRRRFSVSFKHFGQGFTKNATGLPSGKRWKLSSGVSQDEQ